MSVLVAASFASVSAVSLRVFLCECVCSVCGVSVCVVCVVGVVCV